MSITLDGSLGITTPAVNSPAYAGNASNAFVTATGTLSARSLANRFGDVVNVKDFGAVGDGITDDSAAFQAAINSINEGTVLIPKGTYVINSQITIFKKGHAPVEKAFLIEGTGSLLIGTGSIIINSSKRVQINGIDMTNIDLTMRGCWWSQFSNLKFKRLVINDAVGTIFSSNYWNQFQQCVFQSVIVSAGATEPSNEFAFESCTMRGDASQGFTSTAAYAFEFNANQNIQSWKFNNGDISYHTQRIYNVGAGNTTADIIMEFNGVYFDTLVPLPTSRANTRIQTVNCYNAGSTGAFTGTLEQTTCGKVDLFRNDRAFQHNASCGYNLIPNGDFKERLSTWVGSNLPVSFANSAVISVSSGGITGNYLNLNQSLTSNNGIYFTSKPLPYSGRVTGVVVLRNANVGSKTISVGVADLYASISLTNTEWSVITFTQPIIQTAGSQPGIILYTLDSTAFNLDVAYVGLTMGEGGQLLFPSTDCRTVVYEQTYDPPSIPSLSSVTLDLTPPNTDIGDFVIVSPGVSIGLLEMSSPVVIGTNLVRVRLTNPTGGAIDIGSSTWRVKVFKRTYV